ncbi:NADH-quinone oxidoreductase subunit 5 family protein [Actinomadura algeriensis]|uniref:NADH:ubiquinone oxidoreductase subunit 5 (Subunit L)/multisubunit Na+/H+ antiporter MnhA subunit n=1 Tax=Actinomadura algeriensis TaxID=1679523 RepID=A0ABR9JVU0_9ACTN|nr:proton-conducting transporter membrane subunit [Actinomadura algeriensis]MBE1534707.1 NADH:ubiquinone oxidoreductase subunit 5 (subunit L)/multisubunit Na+/H+ antiporter MnhA subunit [Actinomadura algeriensis]
MIVAVCGAPLLAGALLLVAGRRADRAAPVAAVAVAVAVLGLAVAAAVARPVARFEVLPGSPGGLAVDGLSAVMVVTVAAVALLILAYAAAERFGARFFGLMLVFAGAMFVTVTATDLLLLLMGWEVMGAMSYALIGYRWTDDGVVRAADVAFVTTRAADTGLYLAAGFALAGTGSLGLDGLAAADSPWLDLISVGVVVAAMGKSAQLPFSFWLSSAMAGPSAVSALLHSATMVAAGGYLLLRLRPLLAAGGWADAVVCWVGALTALILGVVALGQRDLKQLLAASTCSQVGFIVLAAGAASVTGGASHLVAHAAVKSLLFLCAGVWLTRIGTQRMDELGGAARRFRWVGVTFALGALALAGVPPLSLWFTKDAVLAAALERSPMLFAVGLAASVVAAGYAAKALVAVWTGGGGGARERVPLLQAVPLGALAAAACVAGAAVPFEVRPRPSAWELALSGVLAVAAVAAVAVGSRVRVPAWGLQWLYLERMVHAGVVRPVFALARGLARFDDRVVDGTVMAVARGGRRAADFAGRDVELRVDGVVAAIGRGARALGALARRPQTGQVHVYYAQAAAMLAVLVLIAILAG